MNQVWQAPYAKQFGLTLAAFCSLTVFLIMFAWLLTWVSAVRVEETGYGFFNTGESIVIYGGPACWLVLAARLIILAVRSRGTTPPETTGAIA